MDKWRKTEVFVRDSTRVQRFSRQTFKLSKTVEKKTMLKARFAWQLIQFDKIARLNTKCNDGNVVCFQFFRYWQWILTIRKAIGNKTNNFFAMTSSFCQNTLEENKWREEKTWIKPNCQQINLINWTFACFKASAVWVPPPENSIAGIWKLSNLHLSLSVSGNDIWSTRRIFILNKIRIYQTFYMLNIYSIVFEIISYVQFFLVN